MDIPVEAKISSEILMKIPFTIHLNRTQGLPIYVNIPTLFPFLYQAKFALFPQISVILILCCLFIYLLVNCSFIYFYPVDLTVFIALCSIYCKIPEAILTKIKCISIKYYEKEATWGAQLFFYIIKPLQIKSLQPHVFCECTVEMNSTVFRQ